MNEKESASFQSAVFSRAIARVFSAALRLPTLGYTFDFPFYHGAIARVFAPAHVALWAAFGRLPSQPPLACVQVSGFQFQILSSPPVDVLSVLLGLPAK